MTTDITIYGTSDLQFRKEVNARFAEPVQLPTTTVANLATAYPAATWPRCLLYISDGTSNKRLAVSDGSNWRFPDGNVVS